MSVFAQFQSADILLLYPPFSATLCINNTRYTFEDAMGAWHRCHCACQCHNQCPAFVVEPGANATTADRTPIDNPE